MIIDRHEDLKDYEVDLLSEAEAIQTLLEEGKFKLNHVQLATVMLAY